MKIIKPKRYTSQEYLDFIKSKSCLICNACNPDPHHFRSRGAGGSDLDCINLCRKHHGEIEQIGEYRLLEKYLLRDTFLLESQIRLLQEYIERLEATLKR